MKLLEWQKFFAEQRDIHGKMIFSVAELANAARVSLHRVNTELGRLAGKEIICRYAQGRYGLADEVTPEVLVPAIDQGAYITGFHALFQHHIVTQAPSEITCFTNRRHNRRPNRLSTAGRLRFICINAQIYSKPLKGIVAPPEQAFCDFVFLTVRDGVDPRHLVTFRNLDRLSSRKLGKFLEHYPAKIQAVAAAIRNGRAEATGSSLPPSR